MELMIKVKEYDKYFNLLSESKNDNDWLTFQGELTRNMELVEKLKEFLKVMNCGFLLKKYLSRLISEQYQNNFEFQKVFYDILIFISENYSFKNYFLRNLITNQTIKLAFMDKSLEYKSKLVRYLTDYCLKDEWIGEMLKSVKLYDSLAVYYENVEKYDEALALYKLYFPNELTKIEFLENKIKENSYVQCESIVEIEEDKI